MYYLFSLFLPFHKTTHQIIRGITAKFMNNNCFKSCMGSIVLKHSPQTFSQKFLFNWYSIQKWLYRRAANMGPKILNIWYRMWMGPLFLKIFIFMGVTSKFPVARPYKPKLSRPRAVVVQYGHIVSIIYVLTSPFFWSVEAYFEYKISPGHR